MGRLADNDTMGGAVFIRRLLAVVLSTAALGGCSSWLGDNEAPPLPGERLSVLVHERQLAPDPEVADAEILLPAPIANRDWPQAGGYPNHAMHHLAISRTIGPAWSVDIGAGSDDAERLNASPVVTHGRVFAMDAESLVSSYNAANGDRLWETDLTPDNDDEGHIGGGLAYGDGRLFVTTGFAQVIALNATTGEVLWRKTVEAPMRSAPTYRGGRLFAVTVDNKMHVYDARNGETLWTHEGIAEVASLLGGAAPAVDNGIVVVAYSSGELIALRVENGREVWRDSLQSVRRTDVISEMAHIRGRPVIDRGIVFAMSHGGQTTAVDLRTGQRVWEKEIGGLENLWVAGNYVFAITNSADLVCLSRTQGAVYWVQSLPRWEDPEDHEDPIIWTGPLLAGDRLIVAGSNGELLAVSPYSGKILGRDELPEGVSVAPVLADGTIYFLTDDAELVAYR